MPATTRPLSHSTFANLTNDEYQNTYLGFQRFTGENMGFKKSKSISLMAVKHYLIPLIGERRELLWMSRSKDYVATSSWAFSIIATIEGLNQIVTRNLVSLSGQELVDCARKSCEAWYMDKAFEFIINNGGIDTDKDYPYRAVIHEFVAKKKSCTIDGYESIPKNREDSLKKAVVPPN
ncbi:cysteine proteinase COT44-like [Dioscorea cayenensis subsp. rotundata]|uniref:Cysteine proteinase COT44-like n=1 Tax=Dioscorea cayennensis subsp. rotundata TaxID=55577 RepID=A0AB40BY31_DIOCR|nr:cysteine proteinase COT44-like [Dioscorea cayenensis subsp. rotundata]